MNPGRYFMPNMVVNPMLLRNSYNVSRGTGLLGRMMQGIKSFNWSKVLNGANKTLNVMNQTIPLIKQAKPMVGNVKSMIKLARAFGNETTSRITRNTIIKDNQSETTKSSNDYTTIKNNDYPTFFV